MSRVKQCKHVYRIGYSWASGPRAEVRCRLGACHLDLCEIVDPATGTVLRVSSDSTHNVCLTPDRPMSAKPAHGPFGPEIRLPLQFTSWSEYEAACRAAGRQQTPTEVNA